MARSAGLRQRQFALAIRGTAIVAMVALMGLLPQAGCNQRNPRDTEASGELKKFQGLKGKIDIAGGTAHIQIMNEAIKRINGVNPDIRITVAVALWSKQVLVFFNRNVVSSHSKRTRVP